MYYVHNNLFARRTLVTQPEVSTQLQEAPEPCQINWLGDFIGITTFAIPYLKQFSSFTKLLYIIAKIKSLEFIWLKMPKIRRIGLLKHCCNVGCVPIHH